MDFIAQTISGTIRDSIWSIILMMPLSLPVILGFSLHMLFRRHNLTRKVYEEPRTLIEIKLPREIAKSPRAMEIALAGFYQTSQGNWYTKYFNGRHRRWSTLEIVSIGGSIHFLAQMNDKYRDIIESSLYSQYPDIEIREVEDPSLDIDCLENPDKWIVFGAEVQFAKPNCYPIKTYVDFGLDKDPKEEMKADPLLGIIESMGSIGPGEYVFLQIPIMPVMDFKSLKKMANEEVKKLIKKEKKVQGLEFLKSITDKPTPGEQIIAENIERKLMKPVYDAGIRQIYVARKENFVKNHRYICIKPLVVFNNPEGNEIKVNIETDFGHPYSFQGGWYPKRFRLDKIGRDLFDSYRKRSYFYPPYVNNRLQLNTEELATLWHFPGRVGETPTLGRIESKRGEPPVNLPV